MNPQEFAHILKEPSKLDESKISDVRSIITKFPYLQSARAIYLKGLKDKGSFKYNQELKIAAAYTTDRSVLFDFITSEEFLQNEISEQIKRNHDHIKDLEIFDAEDISVNKSVVLDDAIRKHIKATEPILDPNLFETKEVEVPKAEPIIEVDTSEIEQTPEETLEIGKPLEFDKTEMHSFAEWLKITDFKPIVREEVINEKEQVPSENQGSKYDLVDKFIANNPKMPEISKEGSTTNIAKAQMMHPDTLMTETLARIYVEQKNYEKAVKAYEILSLKYPEKSGFFADQIQAIKELKKQNKSNG